MDFWETTSRRVNVRERNIKECIKRPVFKQLETLLPELERENEKLKTMNSMDIDIECIDSSQFIEMVCKWLFSAALVPGKLTVI